jgi:hypothetical protein
MLDDIYAVAFRSSFVLCGVMLSVIAPKGLPWTNTLAYLAHSKVTKKEVLFFGPWGLYHKTYYGHKKLVCLVKPVKSD